MLCMLMMILLMTLWLLMIIGNETAVHIIMVNQTISNHIEVTVEPLPLN